MQPIRLPHITPKLLMLNYTLAEHARRQGTESSFVADRGNAHTAFSAYCNKIGAQVVGVLGSLELE
jgi:hypothetical protein